MRMSRNLGFAGELNGLLAWWTGPLKYELQIPSSHGARAALGEPDCCLCIVK